MKHTHPAHHLRARRRKKQRRRAPPGTSPGTLIVDPEAPRPVLRVLAYGPQGMLERSLQNVAELKALPGRWPVTWLNVDGLGDAATLSQIAALYGLHKLALEDVVNLYQRPKVEQYGDHLFIVARMARWTDCLHVEQVSLFLGRDYVLTFQEQAGDCLDPVRDRIRRSSGRMRETGADYLAYALLDAIVDGYFPVLEGYGEAMDELEDETIARPEQATVGKIHQTRHDLLALRRAIWPLRDAVNSLYREPTPLVTDDTRVYLRDCHDHVVRIIDMVESYREVAAGLMDVYLSSQGNRMNEIMKVLAIIATTFIPLTFIAGLYGMNFDTGASPYNMPELGWRYGYPAVLGLMALLGGLMVAFFRRLGWLGRRQRVKPPPDARPPP